jgi:prephenate dehydratase
MKTTVAYPGREGAHSAAACDRLFPERAELVSLPSFIAVVDAAAEGQVSFGVLPIESSLSGPVNETHDLLYDSPLSITGETVLPIRHCLVGPALVPLEEIRVVRSHPAALDQCRRLLASLPDHADPAEAAIASERAAAAYGLTVIAGDVGDHPEAYTRFVAVAPYTRLDREAESWRTAFSFVTDHAPGALHRAIEPFGRHGLDLVQLVSRPIPRTPWRYRFDAVLAGHPLEPVVSETLAEVRSLARELRVFGSYPAYDEGG